MVVKGRQQLRRDSRGGASLQRALSSAGKAAGQSQEATAGALHILTNNAVLSARAAAGGYLFCFMQTAGAAVKICCQKCRRNIQAFSGLEDTWFAHH